MSNSVKGTVTSLSSLYSPEDAQKASVRVQETIAEHQKNIQQLQTFLNENNSLINLVKKLPDKLNHDIMASIFFLTFYFNFKGLLPDYAYKTMGVFGVGAWGLNFKNKPRLA